tara:strand:- start:1227 stop:2618 length:1392 start_codon:yes stop_codon:yes gene_type:complete
MATSYLTITPSASNRRLFTISFWMKRSKIASEQAMIWGAASKFRILMLADDTLSVKDYNGSSYDINLVTTRLLRDTTSWYHIVVTVDTAQGVAANRVKLYINGVQETAFDTETYPAQDFDSNGWNTAAAHDIGREVSGSAYFEGQLAHIHGIDGTAYAASTFGETDSTTGEWKPILAPSVTYGSEGFFLKFENSGALGTDSSGNGNNWTVNGNLKQGIDTATNNFPTFDDLQHKHTNKVHYAGTGLYSYANAYHGCNLTQMVKTGKWYFEVKSETDNTGECYGIGFYKNGSRAQYAGYTYNGEPPGKQTAGGVNPSGFTFYPNPSTPVIKQNNSNTNYGTQASANDIIMCAIDLSTTSLKVWFGRNGTWFNAPGTSNVGNPASGTNIGMTLDKGDEFWGIQISSSTNQANDTEKYTWINMGHGLFGTTAVSSGNADGNGIGGFEYAVPSGFYAICTKNIKSYG